MTVSLSPNINMRYKNSDKKRINQVLSLLDNSFPYDIEIIGNMGYTDVISLLRGKDYQVLMNYVAIQDTFPSANFKKKESGGFQLMHKRLVTGAISRKNGSVTYRRFINILKKFNERYEEASHKYNVLWYMNYSKGDM